jgi:hypothetical protein
VYARSIVESRIDIAQRELGFDLKYHSISEIDAFNERLQEKYQDAYSAARRVSQGNGDGSSSYQLSLLKSLANPEDPKLSSEEIRFIRNERALCMCDAEYWLTRYYWIKTQTATIRFDFRQGQRVYFNVIQRLHKMGAPIELIMAKARQLGISTVTEGLIVHAVNFGHSVNAVVASADEGKTAEMSKMTFLGYDMMDWWLKVPYTRRVESNRGMLALGGTRSGISFQHGAQMSGIGRGSTFLKYHLSEVASFNNPAYLIEAALFKCVHPHPDVFGVLESTAEGNTGWFYNTYWSAKKNKAMGKYSKLTAMFLPWTVAPDQYPNSTWIKLNPVPTDWKPIDETLLMMQRSEDYIRNDSEISRVLGANWEITRAQAWWWECEFLDHRAKGSEKLWYQEMPCDDIEAFQSSYENVFGREVVTEVYERRQTRYDVFAIVGQSVEERFDPDPDEIDESEPVIPVAFHNRIREITYKWELQPVIWQEPFDRLEEIEAGNEDHYGKFFVYHPPQPGYDYSIGVRTGNGIGSGETAIAVARRGRDPQEIDVQAAEFRSRDVSHVEAYAFVLSIAAYFSKYMGANGVKKKNPYVAIEQMQSVGDTTYIQMHKMGYRRFHKMTRYDSDPQFMRKRDSRKVGWFSSGWSTPIFADSFVVWVRNGWYKLNSPYSIWEADHWEQHETTSGKSKYIASEQSTDEGLLANAMAAFCVNDMQPMAERTAKRNYEGRSHRPTLDITPTPAGTAFPVSALYNTLDELKLLGRR